jgi:HlyD family secretion protein
MSNNELNEDSTKRDRLMAKAKKNKSKLIAFAVFVLLGVALVTYLSSSKDQEAAIVSPTRETISEVVEVSGQVQSARDAALSFEKSGTVSVVNVKVGDKVSQGQVLASLSSADALASLREAEAGAASSEASLAQLVKGATDEEINVKKQVLENAKQDKVNANSQIEDTLRTVQVALNDVLEYKLSSIFYKDGTSYRMNFASCDQSTQAQLESSRLSLDNLTFTTLDEAKSQTDKVSMFVAKLSNLLTLPCSLSDTSLSAARTAVTSSKTSLTAIYSELSGRKTAIQSADNAVSRAQKDLDLTTASVDSNRVAIARASLNQAYARVAQARAQANKNLLISPFSGIVTDVNVEVGELASQSKAAIVVVSDSQYQVKAKLAEADLSKVKLGNSAIITLDAYGDQEFKAVVTRIDPAATNEGGVSRYGVLLTFNEKDDRLKVGLTANAKIVSEVRENVLTLPASYVQVKLGKATVNLVNGSSTETHEVEIGIRSDKGKVEILKGLNETDKISEIAADGEIVR